VFFAAIVVFFCATAPRFATASNAENLMSGFSFVAILAMGQAFPILVRGIDLSIGAIVGVVGMVVFDMTQILHVPGYVILPAALVVGTMAGALNGILIVFLKLQPFIATLATLASYRGLTYAISGRQFLPGLTTTPIADRWIVGLEAYFDLGGQLGLSKFVAMPWFPFSFFIMLALFGVFQTVALGTRFGRDLYAVGGNAEAARLAGVRTGGTIIAAYAIAGFSAAVAALIMVARFTTSTEALGTGMELTAIAAAVIGGVSLAGGVGSMFGPALGAFLLGVVLLGLTLLGVPQFVQQIITGAILLAAVGYDRLLALRRQRRLGASLAEAG
jgi:ribose/xylose/arabinose/galactoside ABC-type transport system permease subunit